MSVVIEKKPRIFFRLKNMTTLETVLENIDLRFYITKQLRAFDIKMLLDSRMQFRSDADFRKCMFTTKETMKVKDMRVCYRLKRYMEMEKFVDLC